MNMKMSIYRIIEQMTGIKQISDKSKLKDDLNLDSLDQVEIFMNIEKEYKLPQIDLRLVPNFTTVGDLIDFCVAVQSENAKTPYKTLNTAQKTR